MFGQCKLAGLSCWRSSTFTTLLKTLHMDNQKKKKIDDDKNDFTNVSRIIRDELKKKILFLCLRSRVSHSLKRRQSNLTKLYYVQIELMCVWNRDCEWNWFSWGLKFHWNVFQFYFPLPFKVNVFNGVKFNDVTMETFLPNYSPICKGFHYLQLAIAFVPFPFCLR